MKHTCPECELNSENYLDRIKKLQAENKKLRELLDGYEYLCENCMEDRWVKDQERQFTSYWEGRVKIDLNKKIRSLVLKEKN